MLKERILFYKTLFRENNALLQENNGYLKNEIKLLENNENNKQGEVSRSQNVKTINKK